MGSQQRVCFDLQTIENPYPCLLTYHKHGFSSTGHCTLRRHLWDYGIILLSKVATERALHGKHCCGGCFMSEYNVQHLPQIADMQAGLASE